MDKNKIKHIIKSVWSIVGPTFWIVLCHVMITQAAYSFSLPNENELFFGYDGVRHIIITCLVSCLFYYSFVRAQTIFNRPLRNTYFSFEKKPNFFKFVFTSLSFWLDISGFIFVILAFDLNKTYSILAERFLNDGVFIGKFKALAVALPVIIIINILARYNAIQVWIQNKAKNSVTYGDSGHLGESQNKRRGALTTVPKEFAMMRMTSYIHDINGIEVNENAEEERIYSKKKKVRQIFSVLFVYISCSAVSAFVYQLLRTIILPFAPVVFTWKTLCVIAFILLCIPVIRVLHAVIKRIKFIKELKTFCKEKKYKLSKIRYPYRSIFSIFKGESFEIKANGKTYSCKLFSCINPNAPVILNANGSGEFLHSVIFMGSTWFQYRTGFKFGYESQNEKIIIVNPVSKYTCTVDHGRVFVLDNGNKVGDYSIYTAGSFLRNLERDCLGK